LTKLDLSPLGLNLVMDAPEGAEAKTDGLSVSVNRDTGFALKIDLGRGDMLRRREWNAELKMTGIVDSPDFVLAERQWFQAVAHNFGLVVVAGHQDYYFENHWEVSKPHSRSECLLMIACARSIALKTPPPDDPRAAFEQLGAQLVEQDGAITLQFK